MEEEHERTSQRQKLSKDLVPSCPKHVELHSIIKKCFGGGREGRVVGGGVWVWGKGKEECQTRVMAYRQSKGR